jgi:hypothetical protein
MDVFTIFQTVRESGGKMRIGPNGTVHIKDVPFGVKKAISENKDAILDALWSEVQLWPDNDKALKKLARIKETFKKPRKWGKFDPAHDLQIFDASRFANNLDVLYHEARIAGETVGLRDMIRECFAACRESHDAGVAWVRANKDKVMELVDEVVTGQKMLNGRELVDVASEIFQVIE